MIVYSWQYKPNDLRRHCIWYDIMIVWPNNSTFSDWCRSCVHVIFIIIIHFDFGPAMCACNNIYFHYHRISYGISWHHYHQHRFCPIRVLICKKIYSSSIVIVNTFHEVNVPGIMPQTQRSIDQRQRQTYRDARYRPSSYRSLVILPTNTRNLPKTDFANFISW